MVTLSGASANPKVTVKTLDGKIYVADIVGTDPNNDLAVIKISAAGAFTPIEWADSSMVNVGDSVVALGAPLGLENSVTTGVISALNRTIQVASSDTSEDGSSLQWWNGTGAAPVSLRVLQTDAAINPGNSGGALVDAQGRIIGVNSAIATLTSGGVSGSIGLGFSIPINEAKRVIDEIIATGKSTRPVMGVVFDDVTADTQAKILQLTPGEGAEKAGIVVGSIIKSIDGVKIANRDAAIVKIRSYAPGAVITVVMTLPDGSSKTYKVTLGTAPAV